MIFFCDWFFRIVFFIFYVTYLYNTSDDYFRGCPLFLRFFRKETQQVQKLKFYVAISPLIALHESAVVRVNSSGCLILSFFFFPQRIHLRFPYELRFRYTIFCDVEDFVPSGKRRSILSAELPTVKQISQSAGLCAFLSQNMQGPEGWHNCITYSLLS